MRQGDISGTPSPYVLFNFDYGMATYFNDLDRPVKLIIEVIDGDNNEPNKNT